MINKHHILILTCAVTSVTLHSAQQSQLDVKKEIELLVGTYTATKQVRDEDLKKLFEEKAKIEGLISSLQQETMGSFNKLMNKLKNYSMEQLVHLFSNAPEGHKRYLLEAMISLCCKPSLATCKFLYNRKNLASEPLNMRYDSQQNPYELNRSFSDAVVEFNDIRRSDHLKRSYITFGQLLIACIIKCDVFNMCTWGESRTDYLIEGTHSMQGLKHVMLELVMQDQPDKKDGDKHA